MSRHTVMDQARRALEDTAEVRFVDAEETARAVGLLRGAVRGLLGVLEAQSRSVRLDAQADEEFVNLARAARSEIGRVRGALGRLEAFETALNALLATEAGGR